MPRLPKITRRNVLRGSAGAAVILGAGYGALRLLDRPPNLDVIKAQPLPIPELLPGKSVNGQQVYDLTMQKGVTSFVAGTEAETSGYNGNILGPTLLMRKGDDVVINVTNNLGEPTTTHWHGLHLPAKMDGGPYQIIEDGATWSPQFTILNEAATFFYHPHLIHKTATQFYRGLTGLLIVTDPEDQHDLPQTYGVDDIPLIVQDKKFSSDGAMVYNADVIGVKGDYITVNGAITPTLAAPAQVMRFRVLNGSNARIYNLGFSDNRAFHQIGTDGGLLEKPVPLTRLLLAPAERAEILVDFSGQADTQVRLLSYSDETASLNPFWARDWLDMQTFDILTIDIKPPNGAGLTKIPGKLATIKPLVESQASITRTLELNTSLIGKMTINGLTMDMDRIDQVVTLDDIEIWEISNPSDLFHPFHIHDIQFQILTRDGQPPPANERGWKDVVLVKSNETVRFIAQFSEFADPDTPFMYHCHILEHEDGGMMGQFLVV